MNYSSTHPAQSQIKKEEENVSNYKNPIRSSPVGRKKKDFFRHIRHLFYFLMGYVVEFWKATAEIGGTEWTG